MIVIESKLSDKNCAKNVRQSLFGEFETDMTKLCNQYDLFSFFSKPLINEMQFGGISPLCKNSQHVSFACYHEGFLV